MYNKTNKEIHGGFIMKKFVSVSLVGAVLAGTIFFSGCGEFVKRGNPPAIQNTEGLRVHAVHDKNDTQAWHLWQSAHDDNYFTVEPSQKYFFLPTSADENSVDIYNAYAETVTLGGAAIEPNSAISFDYKTDTPYEVSVGSETYTLTFMHSHAEAAVFINNDNADGNGTDLLAFLDDQVGNKDKSRTAKATGAVVDRDGSIDSTPIKKIKGRGNTSWGKTKKSYNVTYEKAVSISGMKEGKKYSLLANYQDDSLSRNRILYDLSDAVGIPYASDSRCADLYVNGYYCGSYQICEKVAAGKNSLVNDIKTKGYLNADGTVKGDFPFFCFVDPGLDKNKDYYVDTSCGPVVIEYPELEKGDAGYEEVKKYVTDKFNAFYNAANTNYISKYGDIDSLSKVFLINELGKNWDAGVSSTYFVYKPDVTGEYKFFGSPVWDYDNSLGNAAGVEFELKAIGVTDYCDYTGWWCKYKGGDENIMNRLANNPVILDASKRIWFESFVPALDHFSGKADSAELEKEMYTADEYCSIVKDSAEMNYKSGWLLCTSGWISDHSSLTKAHFTESTKQMTADSAPTSYSADFDGMYGYCRDWTISRAAWLSQEFSK